MKSIIVSYKNVSEKLFESMMRTIMRCLFVIVLVLNAMTASAVTLHLELSFPKTTKLEGMQMYIRPADQAAGDEKGSGATQKMSLEGTKMVGDVEESELGIYNLTAIMNGGQVEVPLYAATGTKTLKLKMTLEDDIYPVATTDADCMALSRMAHSQGMLMRRLWTETMTEEELGALLGGWQKSVTDADPKHEASEPVRRYLNIMAYSNTYLNISNLPQILRKKRSEINVHAKDLLPDPATVLDDPLATGIAYNAQIIADDLRQRDSLSQQLAYLHEHYKTEGVRRMAQGLLLNGYISRFDYENKYAAGLVELKTVTEKYNLPEQYLREFEQRKASIRGAAFPEGFKMVDKEGNEHSISEFKGKYLYIDFWASWCIPCCKETPYLQKLEAELQNPDVAFLSLSIDSSKEPWLKKMEALHSDGNQWLCSDPKLCEALNIQGIPMFLIYDKEGRLLQYNAPRPSQGAGLKELLEALH